MLTFINGPKDGAVVPPMLQALDVIDIKQRMEDGATIVHHYLLDDSSRDWVYEGEENE